MADFSRKVFVNPDGSTTQEWRDEMADLGLESLILEAEECQRVWTDEELDYMDTFLEEPTPKSLAWYQAFRLGTYLAYQTDSDE